MSRLDFDNIRGATCEDRKQVPVTTIDVCRHCLQRDSIIDADITILGPYLVDYGDEGKDPMLEQCIMVCDICGRVF